MFSFSQQKRITCFIRGMMLKCWKFKGFPVQSRASISLKQNQFMKQFLFLYSLDNISAKRFDFLNILAFLNHMQLELEEFQKKNLHFSLLCRSFWNQKKILAKD